MITVLAIDPATSCGWALWQPGWEQPESGTQVFGLQRGESPGMRFLRFRKWLSSMTDDYSPGLYIYEQAHHRGGAATELCVGFVTRIQEEAATHNALHVPVHSATLKKWATGSGRAGKDEMIVRAEERWGVLPSTHDQADALILLAYGLETYGITAEDGLGR